MNVEITQATRPSRVKPQHRLVVPTQSRMQKRKNWITPTFYDETNSNLSFVPETQWAPSPLRPHSQIHRLPWPVLSFSTRHSNSTSCLCVRLCVCAARTQQVTLSLSQTVVLWEVCRNAAPPKSWQLPQKQWGNVWSETEPFTASERTKAGDQDCRQMGLIILLSTFINRFQNFWQLELPLFWLIYLFLSHVRSIVGLKKNLKLSPTNRKHTTLKHAKQRPKPWF